MSRAFQTQGKWLIQDTSYWRATSSGDVQVNRVNLKCSCCGYRLFDMVKRSEPCPNCGARMDGGKDDEHTN